MRQKKKNETRFKALSGRSCISSCYFHINGIILLGSVDQKASYESKRMKIGIPEIHWKFIYYEALF